MQLKGKYAVKKKRCDDWLMFQPGGRLYPWSSVSEAAVYDTLEAAQISRRIHGADRFAEIVSFISDTEFSYEVVEGPKQ